MKQLSVPYTVHASELFEKLSHLQGCVWLDSGKPESSLGRYDILSALPSNTLKADIDTLPNTINTHLVNHTSDSDLPFCGGWIGYLSYSNQSRFSWYDWALVVDHKQKKTQLVFLDSCTQDTQQRVLASLKASTHNQAPYRCGPFKCDQSQQQYKAALAHIHQYLKAGDCYQVNYTQRFSADFSGGSSTAYQRLRKAVPSPFSAYLATEDGAILSISPERFIRVDHRQCVTQPIKGTISRKSSITEDETQKHRLRNSEKDLAENVMIVDLLRNDFNKHCQPHSVKTPQLFDVQSFTNVHHLVSTITGTLKPDISTFDFIASCFPGGSITGAPKKRAMEIIEELEPHAREVYCGAIGYISINHKADFNIAIRTLQVKDNAIYAWAGGGIVLDSIADQEYQESLDKIEKLLRAVETL